jgi:hypothetical protein
MRPVSISLIVLFLASASGAAAQASPHGQMPEDGESFCGQLFLRAQGRTFGHEFVEFVHTPAMAERPEMAVESELPGPVRAERSALWWPIDPDSLGAYMKGDEGTVWELRLAPSAGVLEGTLRLVLPESEDAPVARAYAMRTPCPSGPPQ